MKILIVEDHPTEQKLAHHVLSAAGYEVTSIHESERALEAIREDRPEIILLDMALPGMDGLGLLRQLKADPETRDIPVATVTSYPERYSREALTTAGCDAYFVKPLSTRTLPQDLENLVDKQRGGIAPKDEHLDC